MRFESTVGRYSEDTVITRVFALLGFPPPPAGTARACAEAILKVSRFTPMVPAEHGARVADLLKILDAPMLEPTIDQVNGLTCLGPFLCIVGTRIRDAVEIHAGVGAIFHHGEVDVLFSQAALITGVGMDRRRDYLLSVIELGRDKLEQTFS
jgi:hypothetical protein